MLLHTGNVGLYNVDWYDKHGITKQGSNVITFLVANVKLALDFDL